MANSGAIMMMHNAAAARNRSQATMTAEETKAYWENKILVSPFV